MRNFRSTNVVERDGNLMVDRNAFDPLTNRVTVRRTTLRDGRRSDTGYAVRMLTFPELRSWLLAAGFRTVTGFGAGGAPLTAESNRLIVVAGT
jgi:hypothetical protein